MTISVRRLLVLAATAALLTGCGGSGDPAPEEATDPGASSSPAPEPDPPTGATGEAVRDLAQRLGILPEDVEVVAVEEVTWRDGSLGCAEPGTMYSQALVEGSRITLRAGGADHEYHAGGPGRPVLCADPTE